MLINANSQLGIRFDDDPKIKIRFLELMKLKVETDLSSFKDAISFMKNMQDSQEEISPEQIKDIIDKYKIDLPTAVESRELIDRITSIVGMQSILDGDNSKFFLIMNSVYKASSLIQIGDGFTSRTLKDISLGNYTYLLGKHRMIRFVVAIGAIKGFYFDEIKDIAFEFGLDINSGNFYAPDRFSLEFSFIMQILTFIELGDIEIVKLESGRNNGKIKSDGKITNYHNYTVFVVDSSWNKLIIRTDGFAVRGHFRLQPCGIGHRDRKLTWINSFEKNGYTRRPKAEIIKNELEKRNS